MDLVEAKRKNYGDSVISRHPWESARLNVIKRIISKHIPLQKGSIVLDIGCGDTFVVESIAAEYPDVLFFAIDTAFTNELMKKYTERLNAKNILLCNSVDAFSLSHTGKISLVILTDVIEHIEDDKKFISGLLQRSFIDLNTFFVITVPAYQALFCSHDVFLGHYRRYTNRLLKTNLTSSGLFTVSIGYFFFCLLPLRAFHVLNEKIFGFNTEKMSTGLTKWNGSPFLSSVFKQLLVADAAASFLLKKAGINLPGLSNYAVCRKCV